MDNEQISKSEFKARALEFLRQVEVSGKSVIITDRGRPTVEIRRYRADKRNPLEILNGSVMEFKDPLEPVATDDWEALV
jgi:antitoxin (DNA-binding transcriptional repressor) of toxin-antitoxin stability system